MFYYTNLRNNIWYDITFSMCNLFSFIIHLHFVQSMPFLRTQSEGKSVRNFQHSFITAEFYFFSLVLVYYVVNDKNILSESIILLLRFYCQHDKSLVSQGRGHLK